MFFIFTLYSLWLMYKSLDSTYCTICVQGGVTWLQSLALEDLLQLFGPESNRIFEALGVD